MGPTTVLGVFLGSVLLAIGSFWLHGWLARGGTGRPGPASMAAFVFGWLCVLTAAMTGLFLASLARGG